MSVFKELDEAWMSLPLETQNHMDKKSFEMAWLMRDSEIRLIKRQISDLHQVLIESSNDNRSLSYTGPEKDI